MTESWVYRAEKLLVKLVKKYGDGKDKQTFAKSTQNSQKSPKHR